MKQILCLLSLLMAFGHANAAINTEVEFDKVISDIDQIYKEELARKGINLQFAADWHDSKVNAYAFLRNDNTFIVSVLGGLARMPEMTKDGLAVVICHEMGFLLGGKPKTLSVGWSSVVGQADYFATAKCMKRYLAEKDNDGFVRSTDVPLEVFAKCNLVYPTNSAKRALCLRSVLASVDVTNFISVLLGENSPEVKTPSEERVDETIKTHPTVQCRLDTFVAGALCDVSGDGSDKCADGNIGGRPACWYKPQ